jgi:hypothetical protein
VSVTAVPTVTVAGTVIGGTDPAAPLVAVSGLRLTWGRGGVLEAPTPATVQLTIRDTARGAPFARRTDLIGQPIVTGWTTSGGTSGTNFRGRITDVNVTPRPRGGFYVQLAASSVEVDLANYTIPEGTTWPNETFAARRTRIAALLPAGSFTGGVLLPDRFDLGLQASITPDADLDTYPAALVDAGGRTLLELLQELFRSTSPLPMVYDPSADRLTFAPRRRYAFNTPAGLTMSAQLMPSPDHGGRYVPASLAGHALDAQKLGYDGALSQPLDSRLTRVEVNYLDSAAGYGQRTQALSSPDDQAAEPLIGRRTLTVDSIHADLLKAAQLCVLYSNVVNHEARAPRLNAVAYSSAKEPVPTAALAGVLLAGRETGDTVFLRRSWLPRLGRNPLVGILGGTVAYSRGAWSVEFVPAPVYLDPAPHTYAPVTVAALAADDTVRLSDVDPSVRLGDLGYLEVGAGFTSTTVLPYEGNPL